MSLTASATPWRSAPLRWLPELASSPLAMPKIVSQTV